MTSYRVGDNSVTVATLVFDWLLDKQFNHQWSLHLCRVRCYQKFDPKWWL